MLLILCCFLLLISSGVVSGGDLKPNVIEPHLLSFGSLWNAIMLEDSLVVDGQQWSLSSTVYWAESTKLLVIREWWITYRNLILSDYPHCAKLTGKSGRGKSVFLRYLIFYILLEAKKLGNVVWSSTAEHTTDPRIAFMDRDNVPHQKMCLEGGLFSGKTPWSPFSIISSQCLRMSFTNDGFITLCYLKLSSQKQM